MGAGASGIAISFCNAGEDAIRLRQIERYIGQSLPQQVIEGLEPNRALPQAQAQARSKPGQNRARGNNRGRNQAGNPSSQGRRGPKGRPSSGPKKKGSVEVVYR